MDKEISQLKQNSQTDYEEDQELMDLDASPDRKEDPSEIVIRTELTTKIKDNAMPTAEEIQEFENMMSKFLHGRTDSHPAVQSTFLSHTRELRNECLPRRTSRSM